MHFPIRIVLSIVIMPLIVIINNLFIWKRSKEMVLESQCPSFCLINLKCYHYTHSSLSSTFLISFSSPFQVPPPSFSPYFFLLSTSEKTLTSPTTIKPTRQFFFLLTSSPCPRRPRCRGRPPSPPSRSNLLTPSTPSMLDQGVQVCFFISQPLAFSSLAWYKFSGTSYFLLHFCI